MKNKNLLFKFGLLVFAVSCFGLSYTFATNFHLNVDNMMAYNASELEKNLIPIHFADNGNDFGGFFYFSNGLGDYTGQTLSDYQYEVYIGSGRKNVNREYYVCARQIKGFYYNAERGERLWPLDQETWSGVNSIKLLDTKGGLYTRCEQPGYLDAIAGCEAEAQDPNATRTYQECKDDARRNFEGDDNGYYGEVEQTYPKNSNQQFSIAVGVDYDTKEIGKFVTITGDSKLSPTFIRLGNKYPLGFIYDHNGGVGFVGCKIVEAQTNTGYVKEILKELKSLSGLNDLFSYNEDTRKVRYVGTSVIATGVDCSDLVRDPLLGIVIEGMIGLGEQKNQTNVNIIGNQMDKKMQYFSTASVSEKALINYAKKKAEILCRGKWDKYDPNYSVVCKTSGSVNNDGKTYIVKNGPVTIYPLSSNSDDYYDVFVMTGGLVINESSTNKKFKFTTGGFVSTGVDATYEGVEPAIASLIKGNFIVNGKIKGTGTGDKLYDKYFLYGKITTTDDFASLLDTFQWRCNNGISTEDSNGVTRPCPGEIAGRENPYQSASLVVIDQNYPSPFYNS